MELRNKLIATLGALGIAAGAVVGLSDACLKAESFVVQDVKLCLASDEYTAYKNDIVKKYESMSASDQVAFYYKPEGIQFLAVINYELKKNGLKLLDTNFDGRIKTEALIKTFFIPNP